MKQSEDGGENDDCISESVKAECRQEFKWENYDTSTARFEDALVYVASNECPNTRYPDQSNPSEILQYEGDSERN